MPFARRQHGRSGGEAGRFELDFQRISKRENLPDSPPCSSIYERSASPHLRQSLPLAGQARLVVLGEALDAGVDGVGVEVGLRDYV